MMDSNRRQDNCVRRYEYLDYFEHALFWTVYGIVKYVPSPIGDAFRTLILRVFGVKLSSWRIREGFTVWSPRKLTIGKHCTINEWVFIQAYGGVEIGDYVRIAARCTILSAGHVFDKRNTPIYRQGLRLAKVKICDDVWVGNNVTILSGNTIGKGAVIGAGAVVTTNVESNAIVGGVPARPIGERGTDKN